MALSHSKMQWALAAGLAITTAYSTAAIAQEAQASGEVRRVDAAAGKITIKHGAIPELQLPAMALVYHADSELLTNIAPGDKITFTARREGNKYIVTEIKK